MTVTEILQSVQFIVDRNGKPTAAILDIAAWEAFLEIIEVSEDMSLIRDRLINWRTKKGWTSWNDFEAELEDDEVQPVDQE